MITDAGVFGVAAFFAGVEEELDAEVFGLGGGVGFDLDDDLVVLSGRKRGGGDKEVAFGGEVDLRFAGGGFSGGGDDLHGGELRLHGGVVEGDADGAVFFDEELGALSRGELEESAFAGSGFDGGVGDGGGEGDEEEECGVKEGFHGGMVGFSELKTGNWEL
jgi:hypothetical protein